MATHSLNNSPQIVISIDLKNAIQDYLSCTKQYHDHPEYLQHQARRYAIYRYETFWLPLLAENGSLDITPPLDVHFVWNCHMIAPISYTKDCERIFGRTLPSFLRPRNPKSIQLTEQLWTQKYGRVMPYELNYTTGSLFIPPYSSKIKYPLAEAIEDQVNFYYNVSLGHYKDDGFLNDAIARYKKILNLKRMNPQLLIVPMFDIDLVWRTHQLFPEIYQRDMMINVQQVIQHDFSLNDRISNPKVTTSDHETRHKWFELYGDRLPKNGCMYRGKSSKDVYQKWTDFETIMNMQRYVVLVQLHDQNDNLRAAASGNSGPLKSKTSVRGDKKSANESSRTSPLDSIFAQINASDQEIFLRGASGHIEAHFEADFEDFKENLVLKIQRKAGIWPLNYFSTVSEFPIPSEKVASLIKIGTSSSTASNYSIEDGQSNELYQLFNQVIQSNSPLRSLYPSATRLVVGIPLHTINTLSIRLEAAEYETVVLDKNYLSQLGTTFLFNLENVAIQQGLHKILSIHEDNQVLMNIRHSIINDVHVFTATSDGSIFASCHSLNWSQLPLPSQVSSIPNTSVITLDPEQEEALIIKDNQGDWGIVKFRRNVFVSPEEGDEDAQCVLYHFLPGGEVETELVYISLGNEQIVISSDSFDVNVSQYTISFKRANLENMAQYICLGAALITRLDALSQETFGTGEDDEEEEEQIDDGNDILSSGIGRMNMQHSGGSKNAMLRSSQQGKPNTSTSSV